MVDVWHRSGFDPDGFQRIFFRSIGVFVAHAHSLGPETLHLSHFFNDEYIHYVGSAFFLRSLSSLDPLR